MNNVLQAIRGKEMVMVYSGNPTSMQDNCGTEAKEHYPAAPN